MSHETIYKALYVQGRGELRRELTKCLRTGRALRKPRNRARGGDGRGRIPGMVNSVSVPLRPPTVPSPAIGREISSSGKTRLPRSAPWSNAPPGSSNCYTCLLGVILTPSPRR